MNRSSLLSTVTIAAFALVASAARAAIPSPANSSEDPCIRVCPGGDMNYHIVVRDAANNPVAGASIVMDFCSCPGVVFCPNPKMPLWSGHPKVFIDVVTEGQGQCPYCGTVYKLRAGEKVHAH